MVTEIEYFILPTSLIFGIFHIVQMTQKLLVHNTELPLFLAKSMHLYFEFNQIAVLMTTVIE